MLGRIETHLRVKQVAPTRFGREAASDPRLVLDLRLGREMRDRLAARVDAYLNDVSQ